MGYYYKSFAIVKDRGIWTAGRCPKVLTEAHNLCLPRMWRYLTNISQPKLKFRAGSHSGRGKLRSIPPTDCHRKHGQSVVVPYFRHCGIAIPRLAAGRTDSVFPRSSRSGFYKAPRLRRSELAYLIRLTLYMGHCRHILTIIILH